MTQKGHELSKIEGFGTGGMEAGTDGMYSGINGVDPRDSEARHMAGLAEKNLREG
jgi:hypothetical protein